MNVKKVDLVKEDKSYYKASKKIDLIKLEKIPYLTLAGQGEPAGQEFLNKLSLIYPLAYGVKKLSTYFSGGGGANGEFDFIASGLQV